jgi:hypothetical protein
VKERWTNRALWFVYLALLGVLLPHTAWAFSRFEPDNKWGQATAWLAAFAFEAAIAVLTSKLARHIETTPRYRGEDIEKRKFRYRYVNAYSFGLLVSTIVSMVANLAHAVEFGQTLAIFSSPLASPGLFSVAFGAILPIVSLLFARVLSNVAEAEEEENEELKEAKTAIKELRKELKATEAQITAAEQRAIEAETRFGAAGDLFARLFATEKRVRILAVAETWPALPQSSIAKIAESSPAYVSEVLREDAGDNGHQPQPEPAEAAEVEQ